MNEQNVYSNIIEYIEINKEYNEKTLKDLYSIIEKNINKLDEDTVKSMLKATILNDIIREFLGPILKLKEELNNT